MLPSLINLDLNGLHVTQLRSTRLANLKNDLMMLVLNSSEWYRDYSVELAAYRAGRRKRPFAPPYPTERIERIETMVDALIRESVDSSYKR